jgi:8-oxo-dGTP pyrophosphatase MutT (NUDIX family)
MAAIHKAGLLLIREGRLLLCRKKHGTPLLILPGGKFEPGETPDQCLRRELREEIGVEDREGFKFVGTYEDAAAGEVDKTVRIELYSGELNGEPSPRSEIAELVWFGKEDDRAQLSPSIRNKILPDLIAREVLAWKK